MNFLLVECRSDQSFFSKRGELISLPTHSYPLGLLYIAGALESNAHKVKLIHYISSESCMKEIKGCLNEIDIVGISVSTKGLKEADFLAKTIKNFDNEIPIVIGGPHCNLYPKKSLLDIPNADICVQGDGEQVLNDIAMALKDRKRLDNIPGVTFVENGRIKGGSPPRLIKDLDSLPFPARHLVEKYDYGKINNVYLTRPKITSMETSRGCPFGCRFCSQPDYARKNYRQRSAESVTMEIQEIGEKYRSVYIVDDNFLLDKKRAHEIMDNLIQIGSDVNLLIIGARVDSADVDLFKKMKKAGVKSIEFGLESGNQDVLDYYQKGTTLEQITTAVNLSIKMGFFTIGNFILGAPIETKKHIENTIKFACSLPLDIIVLSPFLYVPRSEIWLEAVESGKIDENEHYDVHPNYEKGLGNFTNQRLNDYCSEAYKRFYFRPSYVCRALFRSINRRNFGLIKLGIKNIF